MVTFAKITLCVVMKEGNGSARILFQYALNLFLFVSRKVKYSLPGVVLMWVLLGPCHYRSSFNHAHTIDDNLTIVHMAPSVNEKN